MCTYSLFLTQLYYNVCGVFFTCAFCSRRFRSGVPLIDERPISYKMISTNSPPTRHLSLSIPLFFTHTHTGFLSPRSLRFQCCVQRRWCYRVPLVTQTDPELSVAFGSGSHTALYSHWLWGHSHSHSSKRRNGWAHTCVHSDWVGLWERTAHTHARHSTYTAPLAQYLLHEPSAPDFHSFTHTISLSVYLSLSLSLLW